MYDVHEAQTPSPGSSVNAGTLALNYDATNVASTQQDQLPLPLVEEETPISNHIKSLGTIKNLVMGPVGVGNQERLFWRGPTAIYWTSTLSITS
jgi:hypothetical protein